MSHPAHIDRFRVVRLIGSGGTGHVYEAVDTEIQRWVALKVLSRNLLSDNPERLQRLFVKASAANAIGHPGVVQISEAKFLQEGSGYRNLRGMARDFLRSHTMGLGCLTLRAQQVAASMPAPLTDVALPYAKLMEQEYRFACQGHPSYVAHEFLASENRAYWRSEFLKLVQAWDLKYIADADFNYASDRSPESLPERIASCGREGLSHEDTIVLLSDRQMHSPLLTYQVNTIVSFTEDEFLRLFFASSLQPIRVDGTEPWSFHYTSCHEVQVKEKPMRDALLALAPLWPKPVCIDRMFCDVKPWMDDLRILHRRGMVDLLASEPETLHADARLSAAEQHLGGHHRAPFHRYEG